MKVLIISDSHGLEHELQEVIDRHRDHVDLIIHCGDSELPNNHPSLKGVNVVGGNCDRSDEFQLEWTTTFNDCLLFVTHGHLNNVKMTYVPLSYRADEIGARIVCFGHSHVAVSFEENGVIFINPGSLRQPRDGQKKTYCICERNENETFVTYYEQTGEVVDQMTQRFQNK